MKIQSRLLLLTISETIIVMVIALLVSSYLTRAALETHAREMLDVVMSARYSALVSHFDTIHKEMQVLSLAPGTIMSLAALTEGYAKLGGNAQTLLQQNYLAVKGADKNSKPPALSGSDYEQAHAAAYPFFLRRHDIYGWYDTFLIDPQGNVVFSVAKEVDFATNLVTGPWKDTGLARAVTPLLHAAVPGVMSYADYSHYAPSANKPAGFLAMPVFDPDKQTFLGVVAIQMPIQQTNELMKDQTGLGESGETFLVGKDGWMLTDSRFCKESTILSKQLKTKAVANVLKGESGLEQYPDYRGIDVFVAFKPIQPFRDDAALGDHAQWGVIVKVNKAEVLEEFYRLRLMMLLTGGALALLAAAIGWWGARSITRPLLQIKDALAGLAKGKFAGIIPGLERRDEIGELAKAAEIFRQVTQQLEHEHWLAENVTALTNAVSTETRIDKAADSLLHLLCEKLAVPVGAIYLLIGDCYRQIGAHGLARRSQTEDGFHLGEGLPGQCAKDNQALVLSPVPSGLSIISTGLAEFPPHELVLYPIAHKDQVLAVLELAAARSLDPIEHELLKAASGTLGLHLANLQAAEHNLELLTETTRQSAELKAQQEELLKSNAEMHVLTEELRSTAEEMTAQNEELRANQEELRAQQEEMQHKNQLLETQSVQLEQMVAEARIRADDLQRANQYKSEFLANMSHELRTPLNSVLILSKSLAENEENNLTPEQVESASVISESGTQLLTLINDILDLSKIEAGKLELLQETFPLDDLLTYLRRIFSPQAEKKQLAFTIQVDPAVPETITTDKQRLTQVLSNLLSNAIKFTDSGIGIPADKLDHIFGAFQQVDGTNARKYGGSGLGLAISRHLTELLGGVIEVKSEPGEGSRFTVRLPNQFAGAGKAQDPAVRQEASDQSAVADRRGGILVVEDDARLLAILGRMIKALGVEALCVESAELAMAAIAKEAPMGILLDLRLPQMSGMELLRRLKADKATAQIPVYIMSAAADNGEVKVLGALGFLSKPVTRDAISAAIKTMIMAGQTLSVRRVLLVDDNPADIESIQKLFKPDALEVVPANTGSGALQLLEAQCFDTVILDLQLPDMTGFEWLKQARFLLNPPPVVVYSARELSETEVFELKETAESIVNKGALSDRLREEVLRAAQSGSGKIAAPANASGCGKKLLVVDDDARNLFALTKVLRAEGFAIEAASNSAQALDALQQSHFDAVPTDIMMPEMDGYALIRQIRALGYSGMPILAITAKAMQGDEALCMQAGATAYFAKPVDVDQLLEQLKGI